MCVCYDSVTAQAGHWRGGRGGAAAGRRVAAGGRRRRGAEDQSDGRGRLAAVRYAPRSCNVRFLVRQSRVPFVVNDCLSLENGRVTCSGPGAAVVSAGRAGRRPRRRMGLRRAIGVLGDDHR